VGVCIDLDVGPARQDLHSTSVWQRQSRRTTDLFPLKFEVREPEISSRQTNRIRVSVTKHIELVFYSTKRSEVSHITQITSSNLGSRIGLAVFINLPRIMIRLRDAVHDQSLIAYST
jgi:hypothetical protein